MANLVQVTPLFHVPNFASALDLFTRVLGFVILFRMTNYAYLEREEVGVRILENPDRPVVDPSQARMTVYFDVRDVDLLFTELKPELDSLPVDDVKGPVNQTWGQRELLVRAPDGHWMAFGQPVNARVETASCT